MGDGTSYIKVGTEWTDKSVFVLDKFHLKKYINHLNYDKYLKTKLQEAIDKYNPISTENIMVEAIRKKANKKLSGTAGVKIPIGMARDELYYELKNIWYGKAV